jgi:predicted amidophosphoribosyltransferase
MLPGMVFARDYSKQPGIYNISLIFCPLLKEGSKIIISGGDNMENPTNIGVNNDRSRQINIIRQEINQMQGKLNALFLKLGQFCDADNIMLPDSGCESITQNLADCKNRLSSLHVQILHLQGLTVCPCCGAEISTSSKFCMSCGTENPAQEAPEELTPEQRAERKQQLLSLQTEENQIHNRMERTLVDLGRVYSEQSDRKIDAKYTAVYDQISASTQKLQDLSEQLVDLQGFFSCPNCGVHVPSGAKFCPHCGAERSSLVDCSKFADVPPAKTTAVNTPQPAVQRPSSQPVIQPIMQQPLQPAAPTVKSGNVDGKTAATVSMILGIIAVSLCLFGYSAIVSVILGIIGLVFASKSKTAGFIGGTRTAGFVLSLIGLIGGSVIFVSCIACVGTMGTLGALNNLPNLYEY